MAMKIPCVVSSLANNAIGTIHDVSILVADTPEEYAFQINRLLSDESVYRQIADNAYNFVKQNFSWQSAGKILASALQLED